MEEVILVDEHDEQVGVMEKMEAHTRAVLHRAFSVFIFNSQGQMLLQQRALNKYHSGGLWTNACCSHPRPGEDTVSAAERRLHEELGFSVKLRKVFDFTYHAPFENGLTEHEFDHVFVGAFDGQVQPNSTEVKDYDFRSIDDITTSLQQQPEIYTAWFHLAYPKILAWLKQKQ